MSEFINRQLVDIDIGRENKQECKWSLVYPFKIFCNLLCLHAIPKDIMYTKRFCSLVKELGPSEILKRHLRLKFERV